MSTLHEGPTVTVDAAGAIVLLAALQDHLARCKSNRVPPDDRLSSLVDDLTIVARTYRAERVGICGMPPNEASVTLHMSTKEAAETVGCTEREIRAKAQRRTLRARKVGKAWQIDAADVFELADRRAG